MAYTGLINAQTVSSSVPFGANNSNPVDARLVVAKYEDLTGTTHWENATSDNAPTNVYPGIQVYVRGGEKAGQTYMYVGPAASNGVLYGEVKKVGNWVKVADKNTNITAVETNITNISGDVATLSGKSLTIVAGSYNKATEKLTLSGTTASGGTVTREIDLADLAKEYTGSTAVTGTTGTTTEIKDVHNVNIGVEYVANGASIIRGEIDVFDCGEF